MQVGDEACLGELADLDLLGQALLLVGEVAKAGPRARPLVDFVTEITR